MSEAFLSHLFEPFEQERVSGGQSYGGTGLGMPITKNLVTLMGGTISVKSKLGQGSTFTIELDFDLQNEDADAQEQKPHAIQAVSYTHLVRIFRSTQPTEVW